MVSVIVAQADNRVIGKSNSLPWYLPADLKHFKKITTDHTVVMGRKTYESIAARLGGPLPKRTNIVLTHSTDLPDVRTVTSLGEVLDEVDPDQEVFILGGASVYQQALPYVDRIYMTQIYADIDGDTYFPEIDPKQWQETSREKHQADDKNAYDYDFVVLERVR